ncbi:recombinase family protein [Aeromonas hydrophila]|uniref:recombinase family protein n=1 Tax=Aeromonas hydrophila TaxID=644 RepID=UPI000D0E092C|nr:recombinase family protein [Aeromonas hydrophila]AVP84535.1 hypothetical protein C7K70_10995 [Aeromonas hydrophila]
MSQKQAILYSRFSSTQQSDGNSMERQLKAAISYCERNALELSSIRFSDLGVSGWSGVERDGLAALLRCVREGYVPNNSYILVEDADRLSRQGFMHVLQLVTELVETGCTFVTLSNGQQYTKHNVKNLSTALPLIIAADLAQIESQKKSERLRAVKTQKRMDRVIQGNQPFWITIVDGIPKLNDKAELARRIVDLTLKGYRPLHIARLFNSEGIPSPRGKNWAVAVIRRILSNTILYGAKSYHESRDGNYDAVETVKGLYPAICTHAEFQQIRVEKSTKKGTAETGPFSKLLRCPCGSALVIKQRRGEDTYRVCSAFIQNACTHNGYHKNIDSALMKVYQMVPITNKVTPSNSPDAERLAELHESLAVFEEMRLEFSGKPKMLARVYADIEKTENDIEEIENKLRTEFQDTQETIDIQDLPSIEQNAILRRYIKSITCEKLNATDTECTVETKSGKFSSIYISYTRGYKEPLVVSTFLNNNPHDNGGDKFGLYE